MVLNREYARILLYQERKAAFLGKKRENQILTFKLNFMKQEQVKIAVENNNDFKVTSVKETPFTIVEKQGTFYIAIGNQLVSSKKFDKFEEAYKYIMRKPWELLGNVICYLAEKISQETLNQQKNEKVN